MAPEIHEGIPYDYKVKKYLFFHFSLIIYNIFIINKLKAK